MGRENLTIDPDTFFGDARALLKHPGFTEYKGPPLQSDLKIRQKIEPRWLESRTGDRREHFQQFGKITAAPFPTAEEEESARREHEMMQSKYRMARHYHHLLDSFYPASSTASASERLEDMTRELTREKRAGNAADVEAGWRGCGDGGGAYRLHFVGAKRPI
jgi:hypothetical protein